MSGIAQLHASVAAERIADIDGLCISPEPGMSDHCAKAIGAVQKKVIEDIITRVCVEPMKEKIKHLTGELARMTIHAANMSRALINEPIPLHIATDIRFALEALDKYGDAEVRDKTTALKYVRDDVKLSLGTQTS